MEKMKVINYGGCIICLVIAITLFFNTSTILADTYSVCYESKDEVEQGGDDHVMFDYSAYSVIYKKNKLSIKGYWRYYGIYTKKTFKVSTKCDFYKKIWGGSRKKIARKRGKKILKNIKKYKKINPIFDIYVKKGKITKVVFRSGID